MQIKAEDIKPNNREYILAVSFMDYLRMKNGTPKVMISHQEMFLQNNISYVGLFSVKKMLFHNEIMLFCMYGLIVDGKYIGIFQMNQIIYILSRWNESGIKMINFHLHHLMYVNLKSIGDLIDTFSNVPIKIYIHDFYLACSSYNLLRNGEYFCGGNGLNSASCKNCNSYSLSKRHEKSIRPFLKKRENRITFIAPSASTKEIFIKFYPEYESKIRVISHQVYSGHYLGSRDLLQKEDIINVAFLGKPVYKKGWETWVRLVENVSGSSYRFFVFNSTDDTYDNMEKVYVNFTKSNLNAMTDALRNYNIHVAFLWSVCPETYSYTYNEAFSANTFIITNEFSGNIHDSVLNNKNGIVLKNEKELMELFADKESLMELINTYRGHTSGGPDDLHENEEIVTLVNQEKNFGEVQFNSHHKQVSHITNKLLLWILNKIY